MPAASASENARASTRARVCELMCAARARERARGTRLRAAPAQQGKPVARVGGERAPAVHERLVERAAGRERRHAIYEQADETRAGEHRECWQGASSHPQSVDARVFLSFMIDF